MLYLGDFTTSETVYVPFNTFGADNESITISGLAVTDIEIYKDGSVTQRSSDNGYALLDTDGIDFDAITGVHGFSVDLSDNSDAGFYANGSQFWIVVSAITVNSQTVSFVAGIFTIGRLLRPTTAGRTLDVASTGEAGIDLGNVTGTLTQANVGWVDSNSRVDVGAWLGTTVTGDGDWSELQTDVDAILVDTGATLDVKLNNLTTAVGALNDLSTADVDARLAAIGLDHIFSASITGTDVADNSFAAKLVSKSAIADWDDYVNTTESLQALRDDGDTNWSTATGFSTHSAADVWTSVTRTLTAATNLTSDGSAITMSSSGVVGTVNLVNTTTTNTDMRGTDSAFLAASAPTNFSSLVISVAGAADCLVQGFLNNTIAETTADRIAGNFETFWDNANAATTKKVDDVGGGSVPTVAQIADGVWDESRTGHTASGTFGFYLDAAVSGVSGAAGPGATAWEVTIDDGTNPLAQVRVWVTTDAAGSNTVGSGITDDSGQFTFMLDSGGAYFLWQDKNGYTFTNPTSFTVP